MAGGAQPARNRWHERAAWIGAAVCLAIVLFLSARLFHAPENKPALVRFSVYPPKNGLFSGPVNVTVAQHQFSVSFDGRAIAFVANVAGGRPMLWVRAIEDIEAR